MTEITETLRTFEAQAERRVLAVLWTVRLGVANALPVRTIATRARLDREHVQTILDEMVRRDQVARFEHEDSVTYAIRPEGMKVYGASR